MLKPKDPLANKKSGGKKTDVKKPRVKVRDLAPKKNPNGGALYPRSEPLPIPPEGFITPSEKTEEK